MHLCIDIGNSRCKYGIFDDRKLVDHRSSLNPALRTVRHLCNKYPVTGAMLLSTRILDPKIFDRIKEMVDIQIFTSDSSIPIVNLYETPETLGKDRLAGVIAGHKRYPQTTVLVVDIGTCITYDVILQNGHYHGGNISPGIHMRLKAMHRYTDKLPLVDVDINEDELGKTTVKALQNGAVYGTIGEIESFIRRIEKKFGPLTVIFTGGDADKFAKVLETKIFVHPFLILEGLNEIIHHNNAA